ncbi:Methylamine utilization protein MauG precursor [Thalassovita gelatinovora]|uniref:Methylamine utilization protein MauG n=1 Tax=Thalassovita gelatinovora TaxID=53501 RepID=A0A0N7LWA9_THAGE|nr:cytochrome c peroxidase [Thalassovita gelatinovora]QIZ79021.1 methylamine utilization protein MauG [Thalassovita gelatinovora]CUH68586.1 Methylamine utilization protein MauG precursor [Thalassovita gelatinovora]SEQ55030.1 Cytochrome c peroxidase [Thalassovita gelatinovora]
MPTLGNLSVGTAILAALSTVSTIAAEPAFRTKVALGEAMFFDMELSKNRSQACASCHQPEYGFADGRGAVSVGDDGISLGDRNAPTASYAAFSPRFHQREDGAWVGGQFLDGREPDLAGQAGGPPLNPVEMGMPDKASVVMRLQENPDYVMSMRVLFSDDIFDDTDRAFAAMTESIAAFERTDFFTPFDSKYDRFLRGEVALTPQEDLGRLLFFSEQFTNCNQCHQLNASPVSRSETFTNYEYHNIGVPVNVAVRSENGLGADHVDRGLLDNPAVDDPSEAGKFKVPTLRNVAVTGPYMHNGVFSDLRTVVLFYNKYNSKAAKRQINPETGQLWALPEVDGTLSMEQLTHGPALEDDRIDALVAFLKTLTDARYEDFLED